jgi:hypothetical protein
MIRGGQRHRNLQGTGVTALILIDVAKNQEVMEITEGMVIDKSVLGLTTMNIKANISGSVGSVKFGLNTNANFRTENVAPYAMCGDTNAIYAACNELIAGQHIVTATAYNMTGAGGSAGLAKTIRFTITNGTPTAPVSVPTPTLTPVASPIATTTDGLTNLRLINAPNTVVMDLKLNGEPNVINVAALGLAKMEFNIMAVSTEGVVSVTFDNGRLENFQPFARCGDTSGVFAICSDISTEGQYIVSATGKLSDGATTNTISATIIIKENTAAPTRSSAPSMAPSKSSSPTVSAAPTMMKSCSTPRVRY